jgi:mono/diheme cytochrome c family protein
MKARRTYWVSPKDLGVQLRDRYKERDETMRVITAVLILVGLSIPAAFAANIKAGEESFNKSCKSCHGADGTANPAVAKMMKVDIADLKSQGVQSMSDADLAKIINNGKGKMKPVASVNGASAENVVSYIRTLK